MNNYSVRHVLILTLILTSVVPIVVFGFYFEDRERHIIELHQYDLLHDIAKSERDKINSFFNERMSDVSVLSKSVTVQNNVPILFEGSSEEKLESSLVLTGQLTDVSIAYNYESVLIADNNFKTKLVVGKNTGESNLLDLPIFSKDLVLMPLGVHISDVYPANFGSGYKLFVSTPIFVDKVQFGYLICTVDLESFFESTLYKLEQSKTGEIVVAQIHDGHIFFVKKVRFDDYSSLPTELSGNLEFSIPAQKAASGGSGFGLTTDYRNQKVLAVWEYISLPNWGIVVKIDTDEAFSDIAEMQLIIGLVIILLSFFSLILGLVLTRSMTSQLLHIKKSITRIIANDYSVRFSSSFFSEYNTITSALNTMMNSLKEAKNTSDKNFIALHKIDLQKGEFSAMASHELKTPLVPIKGYLEMLLEPELVGPITPKQREILSKIYESTETMEKLILKLLTVQRLDLGEMNYVISEFDLVDLMNDVHSDNQYLMHPKKICFTNNTKDSAMVSSDYARIKEIFSNLIVNSVDFVSAGGKIDIDGKIMIAGDVDGNSVVFSVTDDGVGISKENQKNLFKKFYQVDTSITRSHGGTGLGLSICKGLVEGLGGKIWINSDAGHGCSIYFSIPIVFKNNADHKVQK